jgi:hypothetical protein
MYEWNESRQREEKKVTSRPLGKRVGRKRKLNWSIGSIIDGNQYNEIFQLNETYSIKIQKEKKRDHRKRFLNKK